MTRSYPFDFAAFPVLETSRLILREMRTSDATDLLRHFGNPEVVKFIDMQPIHTPEQAEAWLHWMGSYFTAREGLRWGVTLKDDGRLIGSAGLHSWNREAHHAEIGYDIAQAYWGEGYATETVRALLDFGWQAMALNRIEADILSGNIASIRILEKLGFKREGVLRQRVWKGGNYFDVYIYSMLRCEYFEDCP